MSSVPAELISPEFLARLEQLELVSRKLVAGRMKGDRRSKRKGFSTEFADHRGYVSGDDLRFIDWNILIRLDRLFVKLFEEEEDLHVHVLIDTSLSMGFGDPTKLLYAKRVAAALSYVALVHLDRVGISTFSEGLTETMPPARGRKSALRVLGQLEAITTAGGSNLENACRSFSLKQRGKGIVILLSDLMDKNGFEPGLRYLSAGTLEVYVVHILSAEEVEPPVTGDLRLVDTEDGDVAEVTVSAPLLARYQRTLDAYRAAVRDYCHKRGMNYLFTTNQVPFEDLVLKYFRQRGLLQ